MAIKCELCNREVTLLTEHHLIPRTRHKNKKVRKKYTSEELNKTASLCKPCHRQVHAQLTEKELEENYSSLKALMSHPEIRKFVSWVRTQKDGHIKVKQPKHRKRRKY